MRVKVGPVARTHLGWVPFYADCRVQLFCTVRATPKHLSARQSELCRKTGAAHNPLHATAFNTATLFYLNGFFCLLEEFIKPRILPNCVPPRVQT
jgi:hypothetical protein